MSLDEHAVAEALHEIAVVVPGDLASRVRVRGRRRVLRRRVYAAAGVLAACALATPVVWSLRSGDEGKVEPARQQRVYPGLYAAPPAPGSHCNRGMSVAADRASHANLMYLPPTGERISDISFDQLAPECPVPHVALVAYRIAAHTLGPALVVEGPNAPNIDQREKFGGPIAHHLIDGRPATELTFALDGNQTTNIYWTEADGGQWHAMVRDLAPAAAVSLANRLAVDGRAGSATLRQGAPEGWTTESIEADQVHGPSLVMTWIDQAGKSISMSASRSSQTVVDAAAAAGVSPVRLFVFRGSPAAVALGLSPIVYWQPRPGVLITVSGEGGGTFTVGDLERAARELALVSPTDPRLP